MQALFLFALAAGLVRAPAAHVRQLSFKTADGATILYGLSIPGGYDPRRPRPLVLALHPGGEKTPYYGELYLRQFFLPGLGALDPIMVAPDCPTRAWTDPAAEQAVMALVGSVLAEYAVDRHRILVTGYSLGGTGTWFMSSRHADLFTAAIVMAGRTEEPLERLARIPTYVIHSRNDEVVPFAQAEQRAGALAQLGRAVKFEPLQGLAHYDMRGYIGSLQRAGRWVTERWGT